MRAMNIPKRTLRAHRIHALMRLVHNQEIKGELAHPAQLIHISAEIDRALESLQGLERHHTDLLHVREVHIRLTRENACMSAQCLRIGNKDKLAAPRNKLLKVLCPCVRNTRTIRHD